MSEVLTPKEILYCDKCGMPPEYCEFGPDFESHCIPWLKSEHPEIFAALHSAKRSHNDDSMEENDDDEGKKGGVRTVEQRLIAFYEHYMPDKLDGIPKILEKYAGKEDQLFIALTKKYGPEPDVSGGEEDEEDYDSDNNSLVDDMQNVSVADKKKRRGASAKKSSKADTRIIIQVIKRTKKKAVTIVVGMDTVPNVKPNLKDVSQKFSRRFAGSSSVKDTAKGGKEVIIQGDHSYDVADFIIQNFGVSGEDIFLDEGGEFVPFA